MSLYRWACAPLGTSGEHTLLKTSFVMLWQLDSSVMLCCYPKKYLEIRIRVRHFGKLHAVQYMYVLVFLLLTCMHVLYMQRLTSLISSLSSVSAFCLSPVSLHSRWLLRWRKLIWHMKNLCCWVFLLFIALLNQWEVLFENEI